MNSRKIERIYQISQNKKSRIEKSYNYSIAAFLGFGISLILFVIDSLNKFFVENKKVLTVYVVEAIILLTLMLFFQTKFQNKSNAIFLKEEKCRSLKRAKELLK